MNKGLIQVDGKFYKKCKVVMLPTEKASYIAIWHKKNKLMFHPSGYNKTKTATPQHLYILSEEEIKEGDYFMNNYQEEIFKCADKEHKQTLFATKEYGWKKIIATTDPELKIDTEIFIQGKRYKSLPRLSNAFLKAYCEQGGIDEVLVEYEVFRQYRGDVGLIEWYDIKVAPDNTITIKRTKDSWNREEVKELMRKAWNAKDIEFQKAGLMLTNGTHFSKWIEENL